jgi:hypothetical protein
MQEQNNTTRLPPELVMMIFNHLVGTEVAKAFLDKQILADATAAERKANLTLIKYKDKLSTPGFQHRFFSDNRDEQLALIKQAEKEERSNVLVWKSISHT